MNFKTFLLIFAFLCIARFSWAQDELTVDDLAVNVEVEVGEEELGEGAAEEAGVGEAELELGEIVIPDLNLDVNVDVNLTF